MDDRRQLTRKEPVEILVPSIDKNISITPIGWRKRNDLGTLIQKEFIRAFEQVKAGEGNDPFLLLDYGAILSKGTNLSEEEIEALNISEVIAICHWICELNGLQSALWMLDPEVQDPGSINPEPGVTDGQKTLSSDDSLSPESTQPTSTT